MAEKNYFRRDFDLPFDPRSQFEHMHTVLMRNNHAKFHPGRLLYRGRFLNPQKRLLNQTFMKPDNHQNEVHRLPFH